MDFKSCDIDLEAESFRIKAVEKIQLLNEKERQLSLKNANYSMAYLRAEDVFIDFLTDSGNSAMSDRQWAALMQGDESYVCSKSFFKFEKTVGDLTTYRHVVPTHQGRAAENILMDLLVKPGDYVLSNAFFETTRAHVKKRGATPVDLVSDDLWEYQRENLFGGNFDVERLKIAMEKYGKKIPFILITVVNNIACAAPVSMENIRAVSEIAARYDKPVFFDACRFAENAYLIKQRESHYTNVPMSEIIREMFSYGDGCYVSAKKDALCSTGGFIALKDETLYRRCQELLFLSEGFPTYGGITGRDLEAIAVGLREGIEEDYLKDRINQVDYLAKLIAQHSEINVSQPSGSSAVILDVNSIYPHLSEDALPCISLSCDVYLQGGVRLGAFPVSLNTIDVATGDINPRVFQFARLAVPRRVYTKSHIEHVVKTLIKVKQGAMNTRGYRMTYEPEFLPHIFAHYEPIN